MQVHDSAKTIGHVFLSVVLTVQIMGAAGVLFEILPDLESPVYNAALTANTSIWFGALIAQWNRRVSIRKRLLSFAIVCAACTIFALLVALLDIPVRSDYGLQVLLMAMCCVALVGQLVMLGTIETPWPIPFVRLWRGEIGLARTYWVWFGLVSLSLTLFLDAIVWALYDLTGSSFIIALNAAFILPATSFSVVSIWRSVRNYQGPRRWRVLARASCVLYGVYAVGIVGGLLAKLQFVEAFAGDYRMLDEMLQSAQTPRAWGYRVGPLDPKPAVYLVVIHVQSLRSGVITVDGKPVTLSELSVALAQIKTKNGTVLYYREGPNQEPTEHQFEAFKEIMAARVPISFSSRPDFSDFIDENGHSRPRNQR
jgi:hypothetical protein